MYYFVAIAISTISLIGACSAIIHSIVARRWTTIGQRFPVYLLSLDAVFTLLVLVESTRVISIGTMLEGVECQLLAILKDTMLIMHILLETLMAYSLYRRICNNQSIDFGRGDWKALSVTTVVGLVVQIPAYVTHSFGASYYWCHMIRDNPSLVTGIIALLGMLLFDVLLTYFYIQSVLHLRQALSIQHAESEAERTSGLLRTMGTRSTKRASTTSDVTDMHKRAVLSISATEMDHVPEDEQSLHELLEQLNRPPLRHAPQSYSEYSDGLKASTLKKILRFVGAATFLWIPGQVVWLLFEFKATTSEVVALLYPLSFGGSGLMLSIVYWLNVYH
jgi:hypothetical protein